MIGEFIRNQAATLLCCGPMSRNCIDAAMEISHGYDIPLVLIASRRQVDCAELGGGYVEGFTTEEFSRYVRSFQRNKVFLARDHGGPWQSEKEKFANLTVGEAMNSAKRSFESDILADFDYIHIDPSVPVQEESLTLQKILDRLFELYGHCYEFARKHGKSIQFELGTEEQNGYAQDLEKFEYFLHATDNFCRTQRIAPPTFVVAQTGTKVMEDRNIGAFDADIKQKQLSIDQIRKTIAICDKYGVMLKEHNTDYLSDAALRLRPMLGMHASNVAPEFGVAETRALLFLLNKFDFVREYELFVDIALQSKKWVKWMLPDTARSDVEKALICGHYVFSHPTVVEIKQEVDAALRKKDIYLDEALKDIVKQRMLRYAYLFKMI